MKLIKKKCSKIILAALLLLIVPLLVCSKKEHNSSKNIVRIGAILPLSGDAADAGKNTKKGIDLALDIMNQKWGSRNDSLVVIYEDTKGDPKTGVTVTQKLIDIDKVHYIIDNSISGITMSVASIIEKNNVVLMATGASSPLITNAGKNIFRIWNSDNEEASVLAKFIKDSLNIKSILILNVNNQYGIGLRNAFDSSIGKGIVIENSEFEEKENDFSKYLSNVSKFDAVYVISYSNQCIQILNRLKELGFKGKVLGTSVMIDPNVQKTINDLFFKAYFPVPSVPDSSNQNFKDFEEQYRNKYKSQPVALSDVGYDAVMLFADAMSLSSNEEDIYHALQMSFNNSKIYNGASGIIQFDKNGDVHKPITIKSLNNK